MSNPDDPAFPVDYSLKEFSGKPITAGVIYAGLTKREVFAAMAMQGLIGTEGIIEGNADENLQRLSEASCEIADALIAELNGKKP